MANAYCTVDLSGCTASQEAPAWQGQSSLTGNLQLAFYTTHKNWICYVSSVTQGWPVNNEPGWWCGNVVQKCACSPSDNCH
jgi:hypothetical protein